MGVLDWSEVVLQTREVAQEDFVLPRPCQAPRNLQRFRSGTRRGEGSVTNPAGCQAAVSGEMTPGPVVAGGFWGGAARGDAVG